MSFDEDVARSYDRGLRGDEDAAVAFLTKQARGGPALELAIGTGRIALPLATEGIQVDGIDVSEPMVARLREKPGGERIGITMGDMAEVATDGRVPPDLRGVQLALQPPRPGGADPLLPERRRAPHGRRRVRGRGVHAGYLHRLRDHQYVDAEEIRVDKVWLDVAQHDPVAQRLVKNHIGLTSSGIELNPVVLRYAWPSELDLMARIAGLELAARWGDWERRPFDASSRLHVSVWSRSSSRN